MALNIIEETATANPPALAGETNEIEKLLSQYSPAPTPPQPTQPATPPHSPPDGNIYDPRYYYVRGKKKGQRKPDPGTPRPAAPAPVTNTVQPIASTLITGAMLILFVDLLMPMIIAAINNKVSKIKVEFEKLQLSDRQKKDIEPIANEAAKHINLNIHPVALCVVALMGMYTMQLVQVREIEKQKKGIK